jgi:hypothetical protein
MRIRIDYWSSGKQAFVPVPDAHARKLVQLGHATYRSLQGGWIFVFGRGAGLLRGTVTFAWRRNGRLLGTKTAVTTGGHTRVDYADPRHHSAATCRIT